MDLTELTTAGAVIDKLGGNTTVARLTGRKHQSAAANWRAANSFPPNTLVCLTAALREAGCTAPMTLLRQIAPSAPVTTAESSAA